jgi:hypothetical protein
MFLESSIVIMSLPAHINNKTLNKAGVDKYVNMWTLTEEPKVVNPEIFKFRIFCEQPKKERIVWLSIS